jgi:biopolymer transport protein ExbB
METAETAANVTTGSGNILTSIIASFQHGDMAMIMIGVVFTLSIALTIERFLRLYLQYYVNGTSFMFEIQKLIYANDLDGAIRICNGAGTALLPKVVKAGLQRASRDESQIQNAIDATSLEVIPKLERRLPYLATIANIATLLGLFGTIAGLIKSFAALSAADPQQRQAILSAGIAEAMNATAFGLIVAIFTMVMHSILTNKATQIVEEIDEFGVKLMDLLSARKFKHPSENS